MSLTVPLFGLDIAADDMDTAVGRCRALIESAVPVQHVVVNAGKLVMMSDIEGLTEIVSACDVVHADGQSVVWAARLLGGSLPERVAGIDLMERLLEEAETESWPVYFLGARDAVLAAFLAEVRRRFPMILIVGAHHGYFDDDAAMAEEIRCTGARLLFVGMSSPRKEVFLAEQLTAMGAVFAMGVGGSFDVWAGLTKRAPLWMQRSGLEWFYRFCQEPRRMWRRYLIGNSRFAGMVLGEWWRRAKR